MPSPPATPSPSAPSPAERVGAESEEIPTIAQFSPTGGNEAVKNVGMPSPPATPSPSAPSPAERVGAESEEIPTIAQFSPTGGNEAVVGISELVRAVGFEPTRLSAQEPKSCTSANSIMPAGMGPLHSSKPFYHKGCHSVNFRLGLEWTHPGSEPWRRRCGRQSASLCPGAGW